MKEIAINEKNQKRLQDLNNQIQQLSSFMRIIGDTLLNTANVQGEYGFSQDFSKLLEKEISKPDGNSVPK